MNDRGTTIDLSLISHTNVGKTTLARTLLRRDVGEVRDEAHVTVENAVFELFRSSSGDVLRLWDTPGFGDSTRLLRRLAQRDNPIGWLLAQVWDRFADRPLYSSQQAVLNVREQADVVLYLVNAAGDPSAAGYVDAEMRVLDWIGKPIIVLLNQLGPPHDAARDQVEVGHWRAQLAQHRLVRVVLPFDSFARCWVQEDILFGHVAEALEVAARPAFQRLRGDWKARNLQVFRESMTALASQVAAAAADCEPLEQRGLTDSARGWLGRLTGEQAPEPAVSRAMERLGIRLGAQVREATSKLLALHSLEGRSPDEILSRVGGDVALRQAAHVGKAGLLGGAMSGALGGLLADVAAGGLTFGAGALLGAVAGALGGSGLARAYNVATGSKGSTVRWSDSFLEGRVVAALLRYLAVAHFGRGRGDFVASEYPPFWQAKAIAAVAARRATLGGIWQRARRGESAAVVPALAECLTDATLSLLTELYPDTA